jgi:carbon-monoxide dehydrogenase medium subunit
MKPSPFDYVCAENLEHVLSLLAQYGEDARLLAGGQSLLPTLALRLSAPAVLIDLKRLSAAMPAPSLREGRLHLHALTRHVDMERSTLVAQHLPLLSAAAPWIAHPAIRNRGTLGGSLAVADPASEWPACALASDARLHVVSQAGGERVLSAEAFFQGLYQTSLETEEMIVSVDLPDHHDAKFAFKEVARRKGDYASVGLAALYRSTSAHPKELRWVYFGVADRPVRATELEGVLLGSQNLAQALTLAREVHEEFFVAEADLWYSSESKKRIAAAMMEEVIHDWFA